MRSIYCIGAVRGIIEHPISKHIAGIYTASAGCVAGALLAGSMCDGLRLPVSEVRDQLIDALANRQFIDTRRYGNIVNVNYLVDTIIDKTHLSSEALQVAELEFEVAATEASTAEVHYFDLSGTASPDELKAALIATMAVPVLYRKPAFFDGIQYVDGGIADPLPFLRAQQSKPSLIVGIASVPAGSLAAELKPREKRVVRVMPGIPSKIRALMLVRNPLADAQERVLVSSSGPTPSVYIAPSNPSLVSGRLELDRSRLERLERLGYEDAIRVLGELKPT